MSDLIGLRPTIAKMTGHWELVVDYAGGDYSDNGLDKYIRSGQKILDRWVPNVSQQQLTARTLETGEQTLTVDRVRFIDTLFIKDPDTDEWCRLQRVAPAKMLERYPKGTGEDAAMPILWTMDYRRAVTDFGIRNGSFSDGLAYWHTNQGTPSVSSGSLTLTTAIGAGDDQIYQRLHQYYPNTQQVTVVVSSVAASTGVQVAFVRWDNAEESDPTAAGAYATHVELISAAGTYTITPDDGGDWNCIALLAVSNVVAADVVIDSVTMVGATSEAVDTMNKVVTFNCPADADYDIQIRGGNFSETLLFDTDISYWSENEEDILIEATILEIESLYHRNTTGVRDRLEMLRMKVQGIYYDMVEQEQAGTPEDMRIGL